MTEENEVKMLEQNGSVVENAENDLRNINENADDHQNENADDYQNELTEITPDQFTPEQLEQLRAMYYRRPKQMVRKHAKIGRNDPCPCGSGKKFKNCCIHNEQFNELREL